MTFTDIIMIGLETLIVLLILWEILREIMKDKESHKLDIGCEYCEEVKKLYLTPDKEFYLCKTCMEGYFNEHPEITDEQKAKVRAKYKMAKASKRKERRRSRS